MQASKGAAKKVGKEMTKQEKQQAREKAQMEKAAGKDGKKRARDESKPGKAKPKDGPAAKKCALVPSSCILSGLPCCGCCGGKAFWWASLMPTKAPWMACSVHISSIHKKAMSHPLSRRVTMGLD